MLPTHYVNIFDTQTGRPVGPWFEDSVLKSNQTICIAVHNIPVVVFSLNGRQVTATGYPLCAGGATNGMPLPMNSVRGVNYLTFDFYTATRWVGYKTIKVLVSDEAIGAGVTPTNTPTTIPTVVPTQTPTAQPTPVAPLPPATGFSPNPVIRTINEKNSLGEVVGQAPLAVFVQGVKTFVDYAQYFTCIKNDRVEPLSIQEGDAVERCVDQVQQTLMAENAAMLGAGGELTSRFEWNFGDANGAHRTSQSGFTGGYLYEQPGRYVISLKVTNEKNLSTTRQMVVNVLPPNRTVYFVDTNGNDSNNGRSEGAPFRTFSRVKRLLQEQNSNVEVRFRRGQVFSMGQAGSSGNPGSTLDVRGSNVVFTAFGTASERPTIVWNNGPAPYESIFNVDYNAKDVHFSNLIIKADLQAITGNPNYLEKQNIPVGIFHSGSRVSSTDVAFGPIQSAYQGGQKIINTATGARARTKGLLVQKNIVMGDTALRAYFSWVGGTEQAVYLDNEVPNSTREHIIRAAERSGPLLAMYNKFANIDRRAVDVHDAMKSAFNMQDSAFVSINNNSILSAPSSFGPLGIMENRNGQPYMIGNRGLSTRFGSYDGNRLRGTVEIRPGTQHVRVSNNHIDIGQDNGDIAAPQGVVVMANSPNYEFNRNAKHILIAHNTIRTAHDSYGKTSVNVGPGNEAITIRNNLFVGIRPHVGSWGGSSITLAGIQHNNTTIFPGLQTIDCNTYPKPGYYGDGPFNPVIHGSVLVRVAGQMDTYVTEPLFHYLTAGYRLPTPNNDKFRYVNFSYQQEPKVIIPDGSEQVALQCPRVPGVLTDYTGTKLRSGSTVTAGAYEF